MPYPMTAAGGISEGLNQAMGLAKDMRAIQTSEAQSDLIKQETAEKTLKLNEMQRQRDIATKPVAFDNFLSTVPDAPGYRDQVKKEMMDAGLVKTAPDGTPYTDQESIDTYHKQVDASAERTMNHLGRINAGFAAKIAGIQQQMTDEKIKPEQKAELQQQLTELQKGRDEFLKTMLDADLGFQQKKELELAKAGIKDNELAYHVEKRQIGKEQIQDYRVFVDKKGNVVKEEPVGKPYANTEGVARVRVEAFGSVPTSTPGVAYDRVNKMWFQTGADGKKIPLSSEQVKQISLDYKEQLPTNDIKVMQQSAPSVIKLANQSLKSIDAQINKLGPAASRWADFWSGKVGAPNPDFRKLMTDVSLLQTRLMKMHVGARGGEYIMKHFQDIIDAGKDSPENMKAAIGEILDYANEVGLPLKDQQKTAGTTASSNKGIAKIKDDNDYNKLPSGTTFIAPDGSTRVKP